MSNCINKYLQLIYHQLDMFKINGCQGNDEKPTFLFLVWGGWVNNVTRSTKKGIKSSYAITRKSCSMWRGFFTKWFFILFSFFASITYINIFMIYF